MPDPIAVRFRDCSCPGYPHPDGDVAYLRPHLDLAGGSEALRAVSVLSENDKGETVWKLAPSSEFQERLWPIYLRRGVVSWNVVDEDGPVPVEEVANLPYPEAYELADKADDIYGGEVLAPLAKRMSRLLEAGPTFGSTPPARKSSPKRRKRSASSS
jgi:hypothetical protein